MARKKKKVSKKSLDAARKRKREWARRQRETVKVDVVDAPVDAKPERKTLSAEELKQPLETSIDQTYSEIVHKIRERVRNGEKVTGEELKLLERMKQMSLAETNASSARVIAQDQINVTLQVSRPKALSAALEILDDKQAPAAVRLNAAIFLRTWSDEEEPPEEPIEIEIINPKNPKILR